MENKEAKIVNNNNNNDNLSNKGNSVFDDINRVRKTYTISFYRETWIERRLPFAKDWLLKHDKEWFEKNKDCKSMNDTLISKDL